jgi:hypothetical protein
MDDEVLARLAALVCVVLAGEEERVGHTIAIDLDDRLVGVLEDDREEVPEELLLDRRQLAAFRQRRRQLGTTVGPGADADVSVRLGRGEDDRIRPVRTRRGGGVRRRPAVVRALRLQAATARAALLSRYCRPSSSRRW